MASVVQKNGMKPLVNGATGLIQLVEVDKVCASRQQLHLQQQQQLQQLQQQQLLQQQLHQNIHHEQPIIKSEKGECGENGETSEKVKDECTDFSLGLGETSVKVEGENSDSAVAQCINSAPGGSEEPVIDIVISNVVCSFSVRCHLNLRQIGLTGSNVEYRRESGMVSMKLRKPYTTASIWSSGNITCTGATSEANAKVAARRFARSLQKLGFKTRFNNFRVVNVLGTCSMPFAIKIPSFVERHKEADYEPELHPGVTYKLKNPKATLKIFSTGSVTVTAPSVSSVQRAIEHIFPLVYEFRKEKTAEDEICLRRRLKSRGPKTRDKPAEGTAEGGNEEEEEDDVDAADVDAADAADVDAMVMADASDWN